MPIIVDNIKTISVSHVWGKIHIVDNSSHWHVEYHNSVYVNSPFICPVTFSKSFSLDQIIKSSEVISFLSRFNS
jgi:hypothetical protein